MPHNIRLFSDVGAKMSMFDNQAKQHKENQMINPFSDWDGAGTRRKLSRDDPNYGKPVEGSKTAERGRQAQLQSIADMVELCDLIFDCGMRSPDGRGAICFGDVFRLYNAINDKCVGLLMRGRKHNILDFEGEMLFQRRDDHRMIELLLPLNTIRHKYGMPERAGCGEVRPELIEELERQQHEKQPARSRSMEQLGLPPPQLHKSKSMELARDTAKGDDGWQLTVETPNAAGRMGRSAENLTQIVEDEGAVGGAFTAAPEWAGGDVAKDDEKDGKVEMEHDNESASGEAPVKWKVGSDDADDEAQVEEKQENASATAPVMWPEVKIVVDEDADVKADITENDGDYEDVNAEKGISDEKAGKENENTNMKVGEASEQASLSEASEQASLCSDIASLTPEAEPDLDLRTSPEHDFWSSADKTNDTSGIKSTQYTPRSKSSERTPSPSLPEADVTAEETATKDDASSHAEDGKDEWTPEDLKDSQSNTRDCETNPDEQHTEKDKGFSFWDVTEDDEITEKAPKVDGAERNTGEETNGCGESSITNESGEEEAGRIAANMTSKEERSGSEGNTSDVSEKTTNNAPTTNGEAFSFWDVSEDEDTAKTPILPETNTDEPDNANTSDSTCHGRVKSLTGSEWDATSAEHPSVATSEDGEQGRVSPRPLAVPHITLSDDSELMPAR